MRKTVLLVLAAAVAATPVAAAAKKKTKHVTAATEQKADPNENSWRLVKDAAPLVLPSWAIPIYFSFHKEDVHKKEEKKNP